MVLGVAAALYAGQRRGQPAAKPARRAASAKGAARGGSPRYKPPTQKPQTTPLMALARRGDAATLATALRSKQWAAHINTVDQRDMPAVFYALEARHQSILSPARRGQKVGTLNGGFEDVVEMLASHRCVDRGSW